MNLAGSVIACDGKHKPGSKWHNVDYLSLPKGFFTGDTAASLRAQGVTKIKWFKA